MNFFKGISHENEVDVEKLPDAVPRGNFKPTVFPGEATFITMDLETTDLSKLLSKIQKQPGASVAEWL